MRLIDADKLYPDCLTKTGRLAISQSQIAKAPTVEQAYLKDVIAWQPLPEPYKAESEE